MAAGGQVLGGVPLLTAEPAGVLCSVSLATNS
jgi:hypothetical protein